MTSVDTASAEAGPAAGDVPSAQVRGRRPRRDLTPLSRLAPFVRAHRGDAILSGVFLTGYAVARIICEYFREPDRQLGYLLGGNTPDQLGGLTMGQLLSIPVVIIGIWLIRRSRRDAPAG